MLVGFSFRAKPGQENKLRHILDNPEGARHVARSMGATRNILFRQGDRFVRVFEFPDGAKPVPLAEVAARDPAVKDFLRRIGALTDPSYDPDAPGTLEAFMKVAMMEPVLDVEV